jgi:hypothetical protein
LSLSYSSVEMRPSLRSLSTSMTIFMGTSPPPLNGGDQRLATLDFPSGSILSRVRCIAWFSAQHAG